MTATVSWEEIDDSTSSSATVTTSSSQLLPSRLGKKPRTQLVIINTSATTVTLVKGEQTAVANAGIRLTQNQTYIESTDAGSKCWQGAIQAVASGNSTVAYVETIKND